MFQPDDIESLVRQSLKPNTKGVAIVVANPYSWKFNKPENTLHGVVTDLKTNCCIFEKNLLYSIIPLFNASKKTIVGVIKAVAKHFPTVYEDSDPRYKRIVFCFAGHGDENDCIHTKDGEINVRKDIVDPLLPLECQRLLHIPKLFFIDACRGIEKNKPVSRGGSNDELVYSRVSTQSNYLLVRSTIPAKEAVETKRGGGFWTQSFVAELQNQTNMGKDIGYILIEVNRHVNLTFNKATKGFIQQAVAESTLLEHVCFLDEATERKLYVYTPLFNFSYSYRTSNYSTITMRTKIKFHAVRDYVSAQNHGSEPLYVPHQHG